MNFCPKEFNMPVEPVHILLKSHMESALDFERTFDAPNIFTTKKKKIFFKDFNLLLAAEEETLWWNRKTLDWGLDINNSP